MKNISSVLQTHLDGEATSLASCWHISRTDGTNLYFTDHDRDLVVDGQTYLASDGYDRSALKSTNGLDTDDMELGGNIRSDHLSDDDLRAGLLDYAAFKFFLVNWQDPAAGILPLRKGWIGEVSWADGRFTAELRGLTNALQREIGAVYTPECQADLGDSRCKIDLQARAVTDVIASVSDYQTFNLASYAGDDGILNGGILSVTSGLNQGRKVEIQSWINSSKTVQLFLDLPFVINVGDTVTVYPGCDKRFVTCRDTFANQINFRGFPHIPGTDALLEKNYG